ncbi:unnamed protein product [Pipistrellus nathusii]|uniref:Uncharacterized protein n=1 Tax=Pipistrellus nathusii TaxID=59473 RepID=A0ABN9ZK97_PIPNA
MGLKCPRLAAPLPPGARRSPPPPPPPPGCLSLSGSSGSASGRLSSSPSLSASSGPSTPPAPNPPPPPRFQPYHGLWGAPAPQAHFSPRPRTACWLSAAARRLPAPQAAAGAAGPAARAHAWRPFLQAAPRF